MAIELFETPAKPDESIIVENGRRFDWINGRWSEKPLAGARSGLMGARILSRMGLYAEANHLGFTFGSQVGYQMFPDDPKQLCFVNGSFVRRGRFPDDIVPIGHIQLVPDLILLLVSPVSLAEELETSIEVYLRVGVRMLWVVYPNSGSIMVYRLGGRYSRLLEADEINGEDVLPGFSCRVEDLFDGI